MMKTEDQIKEEINRLEYEHAEMSEKYDQLPQISAQGPEGAYYKSQTNKIKGKIEALKWAIDRR